MYNEESNFIHYWLSFFTYQDDLDRFKKIYILADPPGIEDIEFEEYVYKDFYMDKCFK